MKEGRAGGRESKPLVTRRRVQFGGGEVHVHKGEFHKPRVISPSLANTPGKTRPSSADRALE